jgi:hypothetical protein
MLREGWKEQIVRNENNPTVDGVDVAPQHHTLSLSLFSLSLLKSGFATRNLVRQ